MTFTKERLQKLIRAIDSESYDEEEIAGWVNSDEILELARIALAARTAEPVAYMYKDNLHTDARFSLQTRFGNWYQEDINEYEITEIPLYTAPPAPVVPDERPSLNNGIVGFDEGWNACRAAMLQGAEPTKDSKLPFEQWISQQTETIDVECGCVMTEVFFHWLRVAYEAGDDPLIPGGYALVPIDMTPEMMRAAQLNSELGGYAAANLSGAYSLFREFWDVAIAAAPDFREIPNSSTNNCRENSETSTNCPHCGRKPLKNRTCSVAGCEGKHVAHGLCQKHYDIEHKNKPFRRKSIRAADKRYRARKSVAPQQEVK